MAAALWAAALLGLVTHTASTTPYTFLQVGQQVPLEILTKEHPVCHPVSATRTSLADFAHEQNGGQRTVTVIAHYFSGCTPGRDDAPLFNRMAEVYLSLGKPVAFVTSLKNGVNDAICESWANLGMGGDTPIADTYGMPLIVDDHDRSLAYAFFEGPYHPEYVVLDHCMNVRHRLGALNDTVFRATVDALVDNLERECPERPMSLTPAQLNPMPLEPETGTCATLLGAAATVEIVATAAHSLARPRDVNFHPQTGHLWVANNDTDGITILSNLTGELSAQFKADRAAYHYMDRISSFSFGKHGWFATCQESPNNYNGMKAPNFFMGPSLYESEQMEGTDLPINVDSQGRGCGDSGPLVEDDADETCFFTHSDMLHSAPLCAGIGWDPATTTPYQNVYWVFDGLNGTLMRFDFEKPHYPFSLAHELANVRRFDEIQLTRTPGDVGHIVVDDMPHTVYVADTGGNRIVAVDADSGRFNQHARADLGGDYTIWSANQSSFEYSVYTCARFTTLAELPSPSGLYLLGNELYVSSYVSKTITVLHSQTGAVIQTFELAEGPMGITSDGYHLYIAFPDSNTVGRLQVTAECLVNSTVSWELQPGIPYPEVECAAPERSDLGLAAPLEHEDGYLNMTMLGPEYGLTDSCMACDTDCDNDMLLMSGYLCHPCLPNPCHNAQPCVNMIGVGYRCNCSAQFEGDHCQRVLDEKDGERAEPTGTAFMHHPMLLSLTCGLLLWLAFAV